MSKKIYFLIGSFLLIIGCTTTEKVKDSEILKLIDSYQNAKSSQIESGILTFPGNLEKYMSVYFYRPGEGRSFEKISYKSVKLEELSTETVSVVDKQGIQKNVEAYVAKIIYADCIKIESNEYAVHVPEIKARYYVVSEEGGLRLLTDQLMWQALKKID